MLVATKNSEIIGPVLPVNCTVQDGRAHWPNGDPIEHHAFDRSDLDGVQELTPETKATIDAADEAAETAGKERGKLYHNGSKVLKTKPAQRKR